MVHLMLNLQENTITSSTVPKAKFYFCFGGNDSSVSSQHSFCHADIVSVVSFRLWPARGTSLLDGQGWKETTGPRHHFGCTPVVISQLIWIPVWKNRRSACTVWCLILQIYWLPTVFMGPTHSLWHPRPNTILCVCLHILLATLL